MTTLHVRTRRGVIRTPHNHHALTFPLSVHKVSSPSSTPAPTSPPSQRTIRYHQHSSKLWRKSRPGTRDLRKPFQGEATVAAPSLGMYLKKSDTARQRALTGLRSGRHLALTITHPLTRDRATESSRHRPSQCMLMDKSIPSLWWPQFQSSLSLAGLPFPSRPHQAS